jgi:hypothetical protein
MPKLIEITGKTFNHWTVISYDPSNRQWVFCKCICGKEKRMWSYWIRHGVSKSCGCVFESKSKFVDKNPDWQSPILVRERVEKHATTWKHEYRCVCGNLFIALAFSIRTGSTKSCGCLQAKRCRETHETHGLSRTNKRLFRIWMGMNHRCGELTEPKKQACYKDKGIRVCKSWKKSFLTFYKWAISHGYEEYLTLDRIENDDIYRPGNCRWATQLEQCNNKSNNVFIEYNGSRKTIAQWSRELNIAYKTLHRWNRVNGYSIEQIIAKIKRAA